MRFIPKNCIPPEAVLARPIIGARGDILLTKGTKMTPLYLKRMGEMGINGAYVEDPLSENIEVVEALSDEVRAYAVKNVFSIYTKTVPGDKPSNTDATLVMETAKTIVDEILSKGDTMLDIFDLKSFDSYTLFHCVNVTALCVLIGIGMDMPRGELIDLAYAALLHDIGKVFIDAAIINKPGKLTDEEFDIIRKHPNDGYDHVKRKFFINVPEMSAKGILEHHERVDGSGYPDKKKNTQITPFGRILAIADVYDALISDRCYRKGMFPVEAMELVQGGSGTMFDFAMVNIFSRKIALFPVGTCVLLSNSAIALIVENYEGFAQRPLVKVFKQENQDVEPYLLNLRQEAFDVTIVSTVVM